MNNARVYSKFFGTAATCCFAYAVLALLTLHVLRPENGGHMISDYAVGRYGWIMTSCFVSMSLGCLMLLLGLARNGPASATARIGMSLLGVASLGLLVSAIFPTDVKRPLTLHGRIHTISFLVNIASILVAAILLSIAFRSDSRWRSFQRISMILASLLIFAFVLQLCTIAWRWHYAVANRFFVVAVLSWTFATSVRLRALRLHGDVEV